MGEAMKEEQEAMETISAVIIDDGETAEPVKMDVVVAEEEKQVKISSFGQRRLYRAVDIASDKWLLTLDEQSMAKLENPPSLADGLDREMEQVRVVLV
jgi:hypothetical protein